MEPDSPNHNRVECALARWVRGQTPKDDPPVNPLGKRHLEPPSGKSRSVGVGVGFWLVNVVARRRAETLRA